MSIARTSPSALGQCLTPRATTYSWPAPNVCVCVFVAKVDGEDAVPDKEQLVGLLVRVPNERTLHAHQLDLVVIESGDDLRSPQVCDRLESLGQVDG